MNIPQKIHNLFLEVFKIYLKNFDVSQFSDEQFELKIPTEYGKIDVFLAHPVNGLEQHWIIKKTKDESILKFAHKSIDELGIIYTTKGNQYEIGNTPFVGEKPYYSKDIRIIPKNKKIKGYLDEKIYSDQNDDDFYLIILQITADLAPEVLDQMEKLIANRDTLLVEQERESFNRAIAKYDISIKQTEDQLFSLQQRKEALIKKFEENLIQAAEKDNERSLVRDWKNRYNNSEDK